MAGDMMVEPKASPRYEFCRICCRPYDASISPQCLRHAPEDAAGSPVDAPAGDAIISASTAARRANNRLLVLGLGGLALALAVLAVWASGIRELSYVVPRENMTSGTPEAQDAAASKQRQTLVPERIPLIRDRERSDIGTFYMPAPDHKALVISPGRTDMVAGQGDVETAKNEALQRCRKAVAEASQFNNNPCYLYAVDNTVVYERSYPPMPPEPWLRSDPRIERPFNSKDLPFVNESSRSSIEKNYPNARSAKALALSPRGGWAQAARNDSPQEAARRALEICGNVQGVACMIVAVDDKFVVPIASTVKVTGFFQPAGNSSIASRMRDDVARRLADAPTGWSAVAVGAGGTPAVATGAADEQSAMDDALAGCSQRDQSCRVIAVGPFSVAAQLPMAPSPSTRRANTVCSEERNTRSIEARQPATISFRNESPMPVRIFWVDYAGSRVLYKEIASGQRYDQSTFLTHPWVVTDIGSNCLGFYLPQEQPREYILR